MRVKKVIYLSLVGILLLLLGCMNGDSTGKGGAGLYRCEDCDELERFIKGAAIEAMKREIWQNFSGCVDYYEGDDDMIDDDSGDGGDDSSGDDENSDFSGTNVQEEGVDEADLVKTDGEYLYYLSGNRLLVFDVSPAEQTEKIAELQVSEYWDRNSIGIFLYKNLVLVLSNMDVYQLPAYVWPDVDRSELYYNIVKMLIVDVSNPSNPSILREFYAEGTYVSSRRIDQSARIVIYTYPELPGVQTWIDPYDYFEDGEINYDELKDAYKELEEKNEEIINNTPLDEFLPRYYDIVHTSDGDITRSGQLSDCEDFYLPDEPLGTGILSVITINLDEPTEKKADIAVVADGMLVYASKDNLFVAANFWEAWEWGGSDKSQIHMFDIHSNADEAIYLASGLVDGWALNQFSMSEYNGFFRVATTKWQFDEDEGWWSESVNQVLVLKRDGANLEVVGSLQNIAPGEQIYAVRFLGNRGFIVTFEQTDPLFTIDLSDPYNPKLVGELQIPGFSNYIHPMGEDYLLTIGVNGDESGWTWGVALNIFDVSDFANPKLKYHEEVGTQDSYSPAQYDHHAFLYFKELLSIPLVTDYWGGGDDDVDDDSEEPSGEKKSGKQADDDFCGFYVYRATSEDGFEQLTTINHGDNYYNEPTRSVVIGGFLYTLSWSKLIVTDLSSLENINSIEF